MKAITLWQPWAWAIANAGKRLENRTWAPPGWMKGERIAIHAGKRVEQAACDWLEDEGYILPAKLIRGAIIATAKYVGCIRTMAEAESLGQVEWWSGPLAWVLEDVDVLPEPIYCRGAQGLWAAPSARAAPAAAPPTDGGSDKNLERHFPRLLEDREHGR